MRNFMSIATNLSNTSSLINAYNSKQSEVALEILRAVEELRQGSGFGSIEIVLHEGRVTQIEKREKFRFNQHAGQENSQPKLNPTAKSSG